MILKYDHNNVRNFTKILNSLGIKRRNIPESNILAIKNGKSDIPENKLSKYKTG